MFLALIPSGKLYFLISLGIYCSGNYIFHGWFWRLSCQIKEMIRKESIFFLGLRFPWAFNGPMLYMFEIYILLGLCHIWVKFVEALNQKDPILHFMNHIYVQYIDN